MTTDELIDAVTARTKGTAGDPLTRDEVAQVVRATLDELEGKEVPSDYAPGD
jgi:nucleoid DNA-binding protein